MFHPVHYVLAFSSLDEWTVQGTHAFHGVHTSGLRLDLSFYPDKEKRTFEVSSDTLPRSKIVSLKPLCRNPSFSDSFLQLQAHFDIPKVLRAKHALEVFLIEEGLEGLWGALYQPFRLVEATRGPINLRVPPPSVAALCDIQTCLIPYDLNDDLQCVMGYLSLQLPSSRHERLAILQHKAYPILTASNF